MKTQLKFTTRYLVAACAAGALSLAATVSAQTSQGTPNPDLDTSGATAGTTSTTSPGKGKGAAAANKDASAMHQTTGASGGASTGSISPKDREFLNMAAKGGMMEVHMGEMAQKQGQSAEVKKLGQVMVRDHTMSNTELNVIAHNRGINVDTRHSMAKLDQANFDQAYLAQMVAGHEKMLAAFKTEAKTGTDADVKAFATKNVPTLQKHLQLVKAAQAKVGGAAGTTSGTGTTTKSSSR